MTSSRPLFRTALERPRIERLAAARAGSSLAAILAFAVSGGNGPAEAAPPDPAARGLDAFVLAPSRARGGSAIPVAVIVYGLPTATSLAPLAGASVEIAWSSPGTADAMQPVAATAGAGGHAHLSIAVPPGPPEALSLAIAIRHGEHARTREIQVQREVIRSLAIETGDPRVVPGSTLTAWVRAFDPATGAPAPKLGLELELLEGGLARWRSGLTTDASGLASARVPIPRTREPAWTWILRARVTDAGSDARDFAEIALTPREETPGKPSLAIELEGGELRPGQNGRARILAKDAADLPIAGLELLAWVGPASAVPKDTPKDKEAFARAATRLVTDPAGAAWLDVRVPAAVPRSGARFVVIARASVEGHALEDSESLSVERTDADAELIAEAGWLIPGLAQRILLRVTDGDGAPVSGAFLLEGDGLSARVTTDRDGEAELVWSVPRDVGARHPSGACADDVAATVTIRAASPIPALGRVDRDQEARTAAKPSEDGRTGSPLPRTVTFERCVRVDRDAGAFVSAERPVVRAGGRARVRVAGGRGSPWLVLARTADGAFTTSVRLPDGEAGGEIEIPARARGLIELSALAPSRTGAARAGAGAILVVPEILPRLSARLTGGRIAPGGEAEVEVSLTGERGEPLVGTVSAVLTDLFGGGSTTGLLRLDTRTDLASVLDLGARSSERRDPFLEGAPGLDPLRRAALSPHVGRPAAAALDPGATLEEAIEESFRAVIHSLEGAVLESTESPDRLRDARRKSARGYELNPELLTLVTEAMPEPPLTPGGEPIHLKDLIALDPQVTFDHVARRVTRFKLFKTLQAVRDQIYEHRLIPSEPALSDPNALLRRLVRDGVLEESMLLDPWGGTIRFARSNAPPIPFLSLIPGWRLTSPGPDAALNTADDVSDPFGRVLREDTPYARAVDEDRLVDARAMMVVGDETVSAWSELFEELTGTALGGIEGQMGYGGGVGSLGTHGSGGGGSGSLKLSRLTHGISTGVSAHVPPTRTDAAGRAVLRIPLGDSETTWRISVVGIPDGASPAVAELDVPVSLPLSVRVDAGASWVEGDQVAVRAILRNRTEGPLEIDVSARAVKGPIALDTPELQKKRRVTVPAGGMGTVAFLVRSTGAGAAELEVSASAGALRDVVTHGFDIGPRGTQTEAWASAWVETRRDLSLPAEPARVEPLGAPRLVLERGAEPLLAAALEALDPDGLATADALADAMEAAERIRRDRLGRGADDDERLHALARSTGRRALGRLIVHMRQKDLALSSARAIQAITARAKRFAPVEDVPPELAAPVQCPPGGGPGVLEAEPATASGSVDACWDTAVTQTLEEVIRTADPLALARAVIALADRPHRAAMLDSAAGRLREVVALAENGSIRLPDRLGRDRSARAVVYAALLVSARSGAAGTARSNTLFGWLSAQRGERDGFGSPEATKAAVFALLSLEPPGAAKETKVVIEPPSGEEIPLVLGPGATAVHQLAGGTRRVRLTVGGPPILARLVQPMLRPWNVPPPRLSTPVRASATWPRSLRAGQVASLRLVLRHDLARQARIETRIPLPPGVTLAEAVPGARQVQGALAVRTDVAASAVPMVLEIPLRFSLSGVVTVPEAAARLVDEEAPAAIIPARRLEIE